MQKSQILHRGLPFIPFSVGGRTTTDEPRRNLPSSPPIITVEEFGGITEFLFLGGMKKRFPAAERAREANYHGPRSWDLGVSSCAMLRGAGRI